MRHEIKVSVDFFELEVHRREMPEGMKSLKLFGNLKIVLMRKIAKPLENEYQQPVVLYV